MSFKPAMVITFLLALSGISALPAQTSFSRLAGTVRDASGGILPGVTLTLTRADTGATHQTFSNDSGAYLFGTIVPGVYELRAELDGFQTAVFPDIRLLIQSRHQQDIVMETGQINFEITVTAANQRILQKSDATLGNVIEEQRLQKLPNPSRRALSLFELQPGTGPMGTGTSVTGSRRDQQTFQLDGIDISDNTNGDTSVRSASSVLTPVESVEEFRVALANPDASFGRSAGANVTLVTRRGTSDFHGSVYWYHQNDNLNANSWNNNRRGAGKAELKDNRLGFRVGGPILQDRTYFFWNYEGRRFPGSSNVTRTVPTQSLRNGILRFRDSGGSIREIDPLDYDPRGLGANSAILHVWNQLPLPNTSGGDGLNTGRFNSDVSTNEDNDFAILRVDHQLNDKWNFVGKFVANRLLRNTATQVDLINLKGTAGFPQRTRNALIGLNASLTPMLTNEFRFGWLKDLQGGDTQRPTSSLPWLPPEANIALNMALTNIDEPTEVYAQRARARTYNSDSFQFVNNQTWLRGNHVFQYGADFRLLRFRHSRDDKVIGSLTLPVAEIGNLQFTSVPPEQRPDFIQPNDTSRYDQFYASLLGIVSNVPYIGVRDGGLQPLPAGTNIEADARQRYFSFYFLDTWRMKPSLSINYGLYYGFTTAPIEKDGKLTIPIFRENGNPIKVQDYLSKKLEASRRGEIFNPDLAFLPINDSPRKATFDTDYRNLSPRVAVAWNPSFSSGFLGKLLGERTSVFRGGYSLLWDRTNTVQTVGIPLLGIGFASTLSLRGPTNAAGLPFRVGVDGPIPLADFGAASSPVVPGKIFSETLSFSVDPAIRVPHNHVLNFTIQRELPWDLFMEVGYVGRMGRGLYQGLNLNQVPYETIDPVSGQSFAQAYDALAVQLRAGVRPADVTPQPFFDYALAGTSLNGTAALAASQTSNIINGNVSFLFQTIDSSRFLAGLEPFNNLQSEDFYVRSSVGRSNYNALVFILRKDITNGLVFDFNYTLSKNLDQNGVRQQRLGQVPNSFDLNAGYANADFDFTHIMNLNWVYELPFGSNRRFGASGFWDKLLGGWHTAGILSSRSGAPLTFSQGGQGFGGGSIFTGDLTGNAVGGIPLEGVAPSSFGNNINQGVFGSNGVGTASGTGLNLFANPEQVFNSFRRLRLSEDTRMGRNLLRAPGQTNLDLRVGKTTSLSPGDNPINLTLSLDLLNALNTVHFRNPTLSFTNPAAFGVFSSQSNIPRSLQFGLRVDF